MTENNLIQTRQSEFLDIVANAVSENALSFEMNINPVNETSEIIFSEKDGTSWSGIASAETGRQLMSAGFAMASQGPAVYDRNVEQHATLEARTFDLKGFKSLDMCFSPLERGGQSVRCVVLH